ncbi:hypothetical protein ACWOMK_02130 [Bacillus thuringiensis]
MDNPNKDKTCFIITPIGDDQSDIRRAADGLIDAVITPELLNSGFSKGNIKVAHRMANPGSINQQVIECILESDLAIANLTTLNPNVMYELAIRHAVRKPVIQLIQKGTKKLPFDIIEERTIFYQNDMSGVIELSNSLREMLPFALDDKEPDNPIYRVAKQQAIMQKITTNEQPMQYIIEQMNSLQSQVSKLAPSINNSQNIYGSNSLINMNGEARILLKFKVNNSIISNTEAMDCIKIFAEKNPDIVRKYGIKGNTISVVANQSNSERLKGYLGFTDGIELLDEGKILSNVF